MKTKTYLFLVIILAIFVVAGFFVVKKVQAPVENLQPISENKSRSDIILNEPSPVVIEPKSGTSGSKDAPKEELQENNTSRFVEPLPDALLRITKKPFGILISPKNSPVQPERFSGYHNAVDLETTPAEQDIDVAVKALCGGKLLSARTASGYGGVAVQSCTLDGQAVTVIYGHIRLSSLAVKIGDQLKAGDFLANLGTGFSSQTDGERKHLHLGIHKGTSVNISGYVQNKSQLNSWIDPSKYLQ